MNYESCDFCLHAKFVPCEKVAIDCSNNSNNSGKTTALYSSVANALPKAPLKPSKNQIKK
jgi:hypothetical protein